MFFETSLQKFVSINNINLHGDGLKVTAKETNQTKHSFHFPTLTKIYHKFVSNKISTKTIAGIVVIPVKS
jgi:hypothetical protein